MLQALRLQKNSKIIQYNNKINKGKENYMEIIILVSLFTLIVSQWLKTLWKENETVFC